MKKERKEKEEVIAAKDRLKQEKDTVRNASVVYKAKMCKTKRVRGGWTTVIFTTRG